MHVLADDPTGDWTAPGVYEVGPGLYRIPLPLPEDGLRAVNVYAVRDGDGLVLVDSGWALAEARELLEQAVKALDLSFADVRRFLVTHVHRDHYTLAVALRREFGTRVSLGRAEGETLRVAQDPALDPWGGLVLQLRRGGRRRCSASWVGCRPGTGSPTGRTRTTGSTHRVRSASTGPSGRCTRRRGTPRATSSSWTRRGT